MGTILRAHDPVLDRAVALKVISTDVEVTDELRARFFREAQACARLSHPNIVTVFDMGEDDGRLFIVMELLEGQELRRLIADRTPLALEDKISIMAQVCDGLHYAHQMGVVHRDVKPGNILLLRTGQVKILDFGIARLAATEGGLTRTGLIMGTLRYISPEQVRGRADHRSDIFSAGAVFYELLSFRPPFAGEDPMQILDQLRTESPPSLTELDVSIPPELAAVVERAMQKDPAQRFADLERMRFELVEIQRRLGEEAQVVRGRVRERYARLRELRTALADRIGSSTEGEATPAVDERGRLATLRALERDLAGRIETSEAQIARADVLASSFERGAGLLRAGQFAEAAGEFEAIVAEMPGHARAREALARARAQAEGERRRRRTDKLVQDARNALDEGGYALCIEILEQAGEVPPPHEVMPEIASLRRAVEARLAAQRQEREAAERARRQAIAARTAAAAAEGAEDARALWATGEAKLSEGEAALHGSTMGLAASIFDEAAALYRQAEEAGAARKRERRRAEEARDRAAAAQRTAEASDAERHASTAWQVAGRASQSGRGLLDRAEYARATEVFERALALYREAEAAAREESRRERAEARAREAVRAVESTVVAGEAEARRADAMIDDARRSLDAGDAAACLRRVEEALALRPNNAGAGRLRLQALEQLRRTGAASPGPGTDDESPTIPDQSTVLVTRASLDAATVPFGRTELDPDPPTVLVTPTGVDPPTRLAAPTGGPGQAGRWRARTIVAGLGAVVVVVLGVSYWLATSPGPGLSPAAQPGHEAAEEMRRGMIAARAAAVQADAERLASAEFSAASEKAQAAEAALIRQDIPIADQGYRDAAEGFGLAKATAERVAGQRRVAGVAESQAGEARRAAVSADASTLAPALWARASATQRAAEDALKQAAFDRAAGLFGEAERTYRDAQNAAAAARARVQQDDVKRRELEAASKAREQVTLKAEAEQSRAQAAFARQGAEQAGARQFAPKVFAAAQGKEGDATAALDRSSYPAATKGFGEARGTYDIAAQESKREKGVLIAAVEVAHRDTLDRRGEAVKVDAETLAKDTFESARKKEAEADDLAKREDFPAAAQGYRDAAKSYAAARDGALEAFTKARADADRARDDMQREKARARSGSPDYDKGVEQERKGNDSYEHRNFRTATGQFKSAGELYAKAKIPSPTPPAPKTLPPFIPDEQAKIKAALDEFKVALESRDLAKLQRVWTGMSGPELSLQRDTFESTGRYIFDFAVQTTQVEGDVARVRLHRKDTLTAKNGTIYRNETVATFTLKRSQDRDRWTIDRIQ